ncbi:hypothetical protein NQ314_007342 [Rhamnusium bicolor]|uniref:Uncharacterized protein n=1 Tax=Rhamnusium bicolor TaxID=1586634 RepID=A0AAV8YSU9_9CUCU|nr:hypothetical protein NQ314_007342 [Rhamnusium bicolor]
MNRKHRNSTASAVSDPDSSKMETNNPEVKQEIDDIIRAAAEEHEQSLLESSSSKQPAKFEIVPENSPSSTKPVAAGLKTFRRPKDTSKLMKSKVQTIKTSKGIITVLESNPIMSKPKEPVVTTPTAPVRSTMYENAFLSFLSNQLGDSPEGVKRLSEGSPEESYS